MLEVANVYFPHTMNRLFIMLDFLDSKTNLPDMVDLDLLRVTVIQENGSSREYTAEGFYGVFYRISDGCAVIVKFVEEVD